MKKTVIFVITILIPILCVAQSYHISENKDSKEILSKNDFSNIFFVNDILGYIDNNNQIEIHKRACPVASKLKSSFGNRILDARWDMHKMMFFDATIEVKGIDRKGMLLDVSQVITSQFNVNIHKITISSNEGIFDGSIELRVHDRDEVKIIMDNLRKVKDLQEVQQIL